MECRRCHFFQNPPKIKAGKNIYRERDPKRSTVKTKTELSGAYRRERGLRKKTEERKKERETDGVFCLALKREEKIRCLAYSQLKLWVVVCLIFTTSR